jgi:hypothetical protein
MNSSAACVISCRPGNRRGRTPMASSSRPPPALGFGLQAVVCLKPSQAPVYERTAILGFYRDSIVTKTGVAAEVGVPLSGVFELDVMHKALK